MPDEFTEQDFAPSVAEEFSEADFAPKEQVIFPSGFAYKAPTVPTDSMARAAETAQAQRQFYQPGRVRPPSFFEEATAPFIPLPKPSEETVRRASMVPNIPGVSYPGAAMGLLRSVIKGAEAVESPLGLVLAPAAEVAPIAPLVRLGIGALGAKSVGQTAGELAGTPSLTSGEKVERAADILQAGAMTLAPFARVRPPIEREVPSATEREITPPDRLPAERQGLPTIRKAEGEIAPRAPQRGREGEEVTPPRRAEEGQARVLLADKEKAIAEAKTLTPGFDVEGQKFTGATHAEARASATKAGVFAPEDAGGFWTDTGVFLTREEAMRVFKRLRPEAKPDIPQSLRSEDLKREGLLGHLKPEKIIHAAYFPKGATAPEIGANHPEILKRLGVTGFETPESRNTPQFGFVTDKGRFITREEAGPVATAAGQNLKEFEPGEPVHSDEVKSPIEPQKPLSESKPAEVPKAPEPVETVLPAVAEKFSNFTETGPGGETRTEMHGTPSGLPPSVPPGPPNMPAELLEASRRLGTLIRTRATLRPGVLGQYVRALAGAKATDRIEVGDLNNQLTMAHEMGHDLDQLLWPQVNLARTVKSLEARAGSFGNAKELHGELVPVSELMRGPITGSRGHIAYRRSAVELIADFFALYAHEPDRARAMAPKFSKAFEAALARNPEAAETIRQLHAGNVIPIAPETQVSPTGRPAGMPGKIPIGREPVNVSRDAGLAVSTENLVKGEVRKFESEAQRARIVADRWRRDVPKQQDRNDVGAFVEGIGNLEVPGDTRQAVISRMTPAKQQLAKLYRHAIENLRGKINEFLKGIEQGEYLAFLENFLPHLYANSKTAAGREAVARFIKNSPNARQRKIPTLQEAVEYGLKPITQDPATLYENYARVNWRVATNRKAIGALDDMRTSGGQAVITPWGQAPPGYVFTDNPLIRRVYALKTPKGTLLWKGGAGIHPDAWRAVRMMLEDPTSNTLWSAYDALNSITRANAFAFSLFHDVTLRAAALGSMAEARNPFRGIARVLERNPLTGELELFRSTRELGKELLENEKVVTDAAQHGLKFSWTESESYEHGARDALDKLAANARTVPVIGQAARLARDVQHMRMEGLWRNTHDAFKIIAYNDLTAKALEAAPAGTNPAVVKERVASLLNDAFGGQEWQTKFWLSPQVRRTLARFFLAPDWTLSTIRSVPLASDIASTVRGQLPRAAGREPIPTAKEGIQGNLGRTRFWAGEMAALALATVAAQYAIYQKFGDPNKGDKPWVWDNEFGQKLRIDATPIMRHLPWRDPNDPTREYVNLGKRPQEIVGWFIHPEQNLYSKMSRPAAELIRQVAETEGQFPAQWKRNHETFLESLPARLKSAAGEFAPFTFQGNQFALSLPYRKGMTKFKAQQAYESTYELAADPDRFTRAKAFLRGVPNPKGTLEEMVADITDAAERNGVPAEEVRKRALSVVRGKYYSQFFKAYEKGDYPNMDKAAEALERLGSTPTGEQESLRRREALQPVSP